MEAYEHRSEISTHGRRYYLQTNLVANQNAIVTSLFHEGRLVSKQVEGYDPKLGEDGVRALVRNFHEERKGRISSLLEIKNKIRKLDDPKAHLKLGEALYYQSLYQEAMSEIVRAVKLGVQDSKAFSILGNCLLAIGDYEKAIKAFKKGIELSPDYPDLHNDLGSTYLQVKRCREAAECFERALELNKYYQEAFLNLALALCLNVVEKEDFDLARNMKQRLRKILDMVIQLNPSLDGPPFQEAVSFADQERYDKVYEKLSRMKEEREKMSSDNLSLELYLILKFNADNVTEEEIDRYIERTRKAIEENPGYADRQNDLGILYTAKCKLFIDKANDSFQKALTINRNFKKAEKNLKLAVNDRQGIHFLLQALLD